MVSSLFIFFVFSNNHEKKLGGDDFFLWNWSHCFRTLSDPLLSGTVAYSNSFCSFFTFSEFFGNDHEINLGGDDFVKWVPFLFALSDL